ncbi:MAG: carboxypeptidase-like regulatory domain-containing protein, partial [Candidatus Dormibacteraceae bacterium]
MRRIKLYGLFVSVFVIGMIALLGAQESSAQANRASITGTVTDSSGAVIPNAAVTATNDGTKVATKSVSNGTGIYSIPNLPPGTYTVTANAEGFKTVDFPYVTLVVDQVVKLDVTLTVGAAAEQVTVTTDAPTLDRETSTIGTNMNGSVVTDLPLNVYGGRQAENFAVALTPGYSPLSNPYEAVVDGTQIFTKDFTVDGTSGTANLQGDSFESSPSMEAIEEVQSETSGLSARNASTNGGVMMYDLKSGTN